VKNLRDNDRKRLCGYPHSHRKTDFRINAINHLMEHKLAEFRETGGFTENLTKIRLEARDEKAEAEGAPNCPVCGKIMRKRVAKKGRNAGQPFWSCSAYPECHGTRSCC